MNDFLSQTESVIVDFWMLFNESQRVEELLQMLPAAIGLIGLVLTVILLLAGRRMHGLRWATFLLYAAGAGLVGFMLAQSDESLTWLDHARWIVLAAPAGLIALSAIPRKPIRILCLVLALIVALPSSGALGLAWHLLDLDTAEQVEPGPEDQPTDQDQAQQSQAVDSDASDDQSNDQTDNTEQEQADQQNDTGQGDDNSFFGVPLP